MRKNIIIGNGINIEFGKNEKLKNLTNICIKEFEHVLKKLEHEENPQLKSLYLTWNRIKKYVPKKIIGLEDFYGFFSIKFFFSEENIKKVKEDKTLSKIIMDQMAPAITFGLHSSYIINPDPSDLESKNLPQETQSLIKKYVGSPSYSEKKKILGEVFSAYQDIYKEIVRKKLLVEFSINKIDIPCNVIQYINENFYKKITLNYDKNLDNLNELNKKNKLIHLHGEFNVPPYKWIQPKRNHKEFIKQHLEQWEYNWRLLIEYFGLKKEHLSAIEKYLEEYETTYFKSQKWMDKNMIDTFKETFIFGNNSKTKEASLEGLKNSFESRLFADAPFSRFSLWINRKTENKYIFHTYKEVLTKLEGFVILVGINSKNDERIIKYLDRNTKITKIIVYVGWKDSNNEELEKLNIPHSDKIEYKHYSCFWWKVGTTNPENQINCEKFKLMYNK